jgi:hypothetical protein
MRTSGPLKIARVDEGLGLGPQGLNSNRTLNGLTNVDLHSGLSVLDRRRQRWLTKLLAQSRGLRNLEKSFAAIASFGRAL